MTTGKMLPNRVIVSLFCLLFFPNSKFSAIAEIQCVFSMFDTSVAAKPAVFDPWWAVKTLHPASSALTRSYSKGSVHVGDAKA